MKLISIIIITALITAQTTLCTINGKTQENLNLALKEITKGNAIKAIENLIAAGASPELAMPDALKNALKTTKELIASADGAKVELLNQELEILRRLYATDTQQSDEDLAKKLEYLFTVASNRNDKRIIGETGIQGKFKDVIEKINSTK